MIWHVWMNCPVSMPKTVLGWARGERMRMIGCLSVPLPLHRSQGEFRNFINRFNPQPRACWEECIKPGFYRRVGQPQDPNRRQDSSTRTCALWTIQCGRIHLVKDSLVPLCKSVLWGDSCPPSWTILHPVFEWSEIDWSLHSRTLCSYLITTSQSCHFSYSVAGPRLWNPQALRFNFEVS